MTDGAMGDAINMADPPKIRVIVRTRPLSSKVGAPAVWDGDIVVPLYCDANTNFCHARWLSLLHTVMQMMLMLDE